ncbi:MAG: hypothetical protein RSE50_00870 [Myroides sp.]
MPTGTFNINQINVNVTDVIPPENFATVDAGSKVGTVYTKAQDNEWRAEVEQNVTSGIKGIAKPDDTVPATGFFRMLADTATIYTNYIGANDAPIEVTDANLNIVNGVQRNEVIFEVTDGVTEKKVFAKVGADGANGTATIPKWVAGDYSPDAIVIKDFVQYIAPNGASSTDIPTEDSIVWESLGSNLKLDETGGALGYDKFIDLARIDHFNTPPVIYNGDSFTVIGGYGDSDANMSFHADYTGSRSTTKIFAKKNDVIEIKSMTNNTSLPVKVPVLTMLALDQTTIIKTVVNTNTNVIQTQNYIVEQDCYIVGSVANPSFLAQVKLTITTPTFTLPTKLLSDENYKDFLSPTLRERILNGNTPEIVKGITGTRQEITLLKYKNKSLIYYGKGWGDEKIYVADYDIETNTASNEQVIINAATTGINATNFKCPTAFVCENKVYLVFSANDPQSVCALYESTDGKTFTQVSTTIANVTGFHNTRFGNHYLIPYRIDGFYYWFIEGIGPDGWWIMKLMKSQNITTGWQDMGEITGLSPNNGARGGACVHYQDGKFKMIYHYSPVFSNLPTYIGYAEADFNNPLYFKQIYAPVMPIDIKPWPGLTDQYADPDLAEIDGRTFLFCSIVNNSQGLSEIWRWECDGRLSDILNSKI